MNGTNTYVDLPIGTLISTLTDTTVATHVYFGGGNGAWQRDLRLRLGHFGLHVPVPAPGHRRQHESS